MIRLMFFVAVAATGVLTARASMEDRGGLRQKRLRLAAAGMALVSVVLILLESAVA